MYDFWIEQQPGEKDQGAENIGDQEKSSCRYGPLGDKIPGGVDKRRGEYEEYGNF